MLNKLGKHFAISWALLALQVSFKRAFHVRFAFTNSTHQQDRMVQEKVPIKYSISSWTYVFLCVPTMWLDFQEVENSKKVLPSVPPSIGVTCFGDAKHEAQSINKSLTALGDVIEVGLDRGFLSDWLRLDCCVWCWFLASLKRKKQVLPLKTCFFSTKIVCFLKFLLKKNVCCSFS